MQWSLIEARSEETPRGTAQQITRSYVPSWPNEKSAQNIFTGCQCCAAGMRKVGEKQEKINSREKSRERPKGIATLSPKHNQMRKRFHASFLILRSLNYVASKSFSAVRPSALRKPELWTTWNRISWSNAKSHFTLNFC